MDTQKRTFNYVVIALEGAYLRREPNMNSKTLDGRENVILLASLGTYLAIESGIYGVDGHSWIMIRPKIGNEEEVGWTDPDHILDQRIYLITVQEGASLLREPTLKSKTEDGRENTITSLPLATRLIRLSNNTLSNDGQEWAFVKIDNEKGDIGWVDVRFWIERTKLVVLAQHGTDFHFVPSQTPKIDGSNTIVHLPFKTNVVPVSDEFQTFNEQNWVLVIAEISGSEEIGWVVVDDIGFMPPISMSTPPGAMPVSYNFDYAGLPRSITEPNLKTAMDNNKFSKKELTDLQIRIEFKTPYNNIKEYWTSIDNLRNLTINPKII